MLVHAAKVGSCPECEKYVILLIDEMHIREDLVYDKQTGELVGFANLGDVNQHLLAFEWLFFMYISLEHVMFTSCNDVLYLKYFYCNVGWCIDEAATKVIEVMRNASSTMLDKASVDDIQGFQAFTS